MAPPFVAHVGVRGGGGARGHMPPCIWMFVKFRSFMASRLLTVRVKYII